MNSHKFKAFPGLQTCMICYRPEADPIHPASQNILSDQSEATRTNELVLLSGEDLEYQAINRSERFKTDPPTHPPQNIKDPQQIKAQVDLLLNLYKDRKEKQDCKGHTCPACHDMWHHDYKCQLSEADDNKRSGLCVKCAQQTSIEINRPITIEQIAQTSGSNLTGREISEAMLEHEGFVVLNLIKDKDGQDYPDWQERVNVHRRDLKRKIELLRAKEISVSRTVSNKMAEDMTKLSPEEIAEYKKNAGKTAGGKKAKDPKVAGEKAEKPAKVIDAKVAYDNMLKSLMGDIKKRKPTLSNDELIIAAEKRYKLMKEMDNE